MLTNTFVGIREVDRDVVEAARGMGMSEVAILFRVELPLAVPLIAAGFRTSSVQVVATATLAALVGGGGLGKIINEGFGQQDPGQYVAGGMLVALLAIITEGVLALVQRQVTPGRDRGRRSGQGPADATNVTDGTKTAPGAAHDAGRGALRRCFVTPTRLRLSHPRRWMVERVRTEARPTRAGADAAAGHRRRAPCTSAQ